MSHDTYTQDKENYDDLIWNKPSLPDKVNADEDIILVIREDIVIPILRAVMSFVFIFFMLLVRIFVLGFANSFLLSVFDALMFGSFAVLITYFVLMFHNYYLSIQIVTTERVIDIDQTGLFNREENTMPLVNIQDVSFKMAGFWGTIFNFGNVIIQTAGEGADSANGAEDTINGFTFNNVPHPKEVSEVLSKVFYDNEEKDRMDSAKANAEELAKVLNNR